MNIEIYENQTANVHITLQTEIPDFEVYGGTSKTQFTVSGEYTVEIPAQLVSGCSIPRYDIFARRKSNGREWPILTGKIFVNKRQSSVNGESVAPKDYYVTIPIVESGVQGKTLVVGIPGDSAYDVARLNGFEGTEEEWLEDMRQQTATLAVEQVTPLVERAEGCANRAKVEAQKSLESEQAAKVSETNAANAADNAAASKASAAESAQKAGEHKDAAEAAKVDAEQAKNDAQQHEQNAAAASQTATQKATEATASATQAAADKTAAEQAKLDAQAAQSTAEERAAIATQAAADAQAPESIAAQAARPATMVLVRDELMSILGDASLFDLDTDGKKIIVHTDRISDEQLAVVTDMIERFVPSFIEVEQYNHHIEVRWRDIFKYASCKTQKDLLAVNPNFGADVTSDGWWLYPLSAYVGDGRFFPISGDYGDQRRHVKILRFNAPVMSKQGYLIHNCANLQEAYLNIPKLANCTNLIPQNSNMEVLHVYAESATSMNSIASSCGKLREVKLHCPFVSSMSGAFSSNKLPSSAVLDIVAALPPWTDGASHPLTLGIHIDHQNDEEVLGALDAATAKGWTVERQWNGMPTSGVTTTDLDEIWCKVTEHEPYPDRLTHGMYVNESGTPCSLNWCHMVTSPDGKSPSELGYKLFFSLVEAEQYFKLTKIEQEELS